jgi:hypothetical protein
MDARAALLAVLCVMLPACEQSPRAPAQRALPAGTADTSRAAPVAVAQGRFHIARPLYELTDSLARVNRLRERAKGIVVPAFGEGVPQELNVVNDTVYEIQTVARVRFYPREEGGWSDTIWTRAPGLYTDLLRATHDDYGLPVTAVHGRWLRVDYAYAADGTPHAGWVYLAPGRAVYHDRDAQLLEFNTTLVDPDSAEIVLVPGGRPLRIDMSAGYTLRVLRIEDEWIQVLLMRPDTSACTGNETLRVTRRDTVWVRRYDARGMRQLTSAVAGC